jgi:Fanconi anemia group J protein
VRSRVACAYDNSTSRRIYPQLSPQFGTPVTIPIAQDPQPQGSLVVDGINIYYPNDKKPFTPQVEISRHMVTAMQKGQNALLESPTGTGKTLALLSTALSWQRYMKLQAPPDMGSSGKRATVKISTIFYCSRTHSQLQQVVGEIRRLHPILTKDIRMVLLASKKKLCQNPAALHDPINSVDYACRDLTSNDMCRLLDNIGHVENGLNSRKVWDIEDALEVGSGCSGCAYFGARRILDTRPDLVLAPYNYLIDPIVRGSMKIDLREAVVVFDEGHNLQEICRSVASCELRSTKLDGAIQRLLKLSIDYSNRQAFTCLHYFLSKIGSWLQETGEQLRNSNGLHSKLWTGNEILDIFEARIGLTSENLQFYFVQYMLVTKGDQDDAAVRQPAVPAVNENNTGNGILGIDAIIVLGSLFKVLKFMSRRNREHANAYRIVLDIDADKSSPILRYSFAFHCLSGAVAFGDVTFESKSVIITSGTLSPLDSFAGNYTVIEGYKLPMGLRVDN